MIGIIILGICILAIIILVLWHSKNTRYQCPKCRRKFRLSFWRDLFSPHWFWKSKGYKYARCPDCKVYVKAKEVK